MPKFIQITDLHYDPHYYSGPDANEYCHPKQINLLSNIQNNIKSRNEQNNIKSSNGNERYGKPGSECDAPLELLQETLKYIKEFNGLDFVLWTGDSVRHDRDPDWKRSDVDVLEAVRRVTMMVAETFEKDVVFPTIGNWDTMVPNQVDKRDYQGLFNEWKILWSEDTIAQISPTFLKHGFYAFPLTKNITIISINTILLTSEDCKPKNPQLSWLKSTLKSLSATSSKAIIIGHIPPQTHLGEFLYKPSCDLKFTDLIGTFSKSIISLYYGHVNRDIVNFVYKTKEKYEIGPLNQKALLDPKTSSLEIVGTLFTGSSVVPYFYPSFRVGVLEGEKVISHTQFSSRIGDEVVFNETCSTVTTLGMTGLGGEEFKAFLGNVQHELDVAGKSLLAGRYWDCSMVHYGSVENVKKSNQGMMIGFSILGFFTILMIHFKFKSGRGRIAI